MLLVKIIMFCLSQPFQRDVNKIYLSTNLSYILYFIVAFGTKITRLINLGIKNEDIVLFAVQMTIQYLYYIVKYKFLVPSYVICL